MTTPRSALHARPVAPAVIALLALVGISSSGGCLVSFDGYRLGDPDAGGAGPADAGDAGDGNPGGTSSEGGTSGRAGAPSAGSGNQSGAGTNSGGSTSGGSSGGAQGGAPGAGAGGGGAPAAGAPGAGAGGAGTLRCPETNGRITIEIPLPGGGFSCIDRSEVRNVDYKAFLDANPSTAGQIAACAFNTSYQPLTSGDCTQFDPVGKKNMPIACVDWCDAAAYCKWEGKRLCGKLGGGSNPQAGFADAAQSEWFRACSNAGTRSLPYGNVYDGTACATTDNTSAVRPLAVPNTNCAGGYSGLYDMSGNVSEWEDSCAASAGASDQCAYRGGSYLNTDKRIGGSPSVLCNSNDANNPLIATKARSTRDKEIGFRCCSDPSP